MNETIGYRLRDLRVEHRSRCLLDISALDLRAGRITVVVGPNGSGKSTLLRVLALLQEPSAGTVELFGATVDHRAWELTAQRRQVTYVGQAPLLFHGSVRANAAYGLRVRGRAADGAVDAALAAVGLQGFANRTARRLSGGEVQRVAIARALAIDPPVLLFDEPTANLDRAAVPLVEALLRRLGDAGKTVVLSTHNLEQAYRLGDDVLALHDGRVTAIGDELAK